MFVNALMGAASVPLLLCLQSGRLPLKEARASRDATSAQNCRPRKAKASPCFECGLLRDLGSVWG